MKANTVNLGAEEVVEIEECCNGTILRRYYCIRDQRFGYWLSKEPFSGKIWTKRFNSARRFRRERNAEKLLTDLQTWRHSNGKRRRKS